MNAVALPGRPGQPPDLARHLSDFLIGLGLPAPRTEKQSRALPPKRFRDNDAGKLAVARRVAGEGGWKAVSATRIAVIADEVIPRATTSVATTGVGLVLVTRGGRVGPSTRAKAAIQRRLAAMATEADAIQALGPYAVADALRAMTEAESNEARTAVTTIGRLLLRFGEGWSAERGDQPEEGQQGLPLAA